MLIFHGELCTNAVLGSFPPARISTNFGGNVSHLFNHTKDTPLSTEADALGRWALGKKIIKAIYFFGSRVRGDNHVNSDLDIAVELVFCDPDTALGHWTGHNVSWKTEIESILPWTIDLQWYHLYATKIIQQGIERSSIHVYEKVDV